MIQLCKRERVLAAAVSHRLMHRIFHSSLGLLSVAIIRFPAAFRWKFVTHPVMAATSLIKEWEGLTKKRMHAWGIEIIHH